MPASLSALQGLLGGDINAANPDGLAAGRYRKEKLLSDMRRNLALAAADKTGRFSTGATTADVADTESDLAADPYMGDEARKRVADVQGTNDAMSTYNRPDVTKQRKEMEATKLALAIGPAEAAAKGNLAVENAKTEGALREKAAQDASTQKLLETLSGHSAGGTGNGLAGPGGTIKPTVNAQGGVSFTTTQMPALVQRARNQLMDARDKTLNALGEAEKQYPGINDESTKVDETAPGGSALGRLFSGLTGVGASKYGGPTDRVGAGIERANYTLGIPTPFANLAQEASFGNIEQMAGQLPGVRGLATITPLFKEHQSRWGHETPLATVQRLRHMARMMDETLHTLDTSGAGEP